MRSFRAARILVLPALVVPLVLGIVVPSGTAWAKGAKAVSCQTVGGTVGPSGSWYLEGCTQPAITGGNTTAISKPFPTAPSRGSLTVTWNPSGEAHRGGPAGTTTFSYSAMQLTGHKDKCPGATEWELTGNVTGNTVSPKVKGKLKLFACVSASGVLSPHKKVKL